LIAQLIKECAEGISNREDEAVKLAALWQLDVKEVCAGFAEARELWRDARAQARLPAVVPARMPLVAWNDLLEAMNEQHAIIDNVGGKTVIASWERSSLDPSRRVWVFQNKESFLLRYSNRFATIEISDRRGGSIRSQMPLGQWWLTHRDRRQYRGITFQPDAPKVVNECLNLWQHWGCEAREGDWSLIRDHIEAVLADGNSELAEYIIRWIAWSIKNPGAQAEVALVLIGEKGAGKGTLVRCLERIFGQHSCQVSSREDVIGRSLVGNLPS
jgi:hypothetical protein